MMLANSPLDYKGFLINCSEQPGHRFDGALMVHRNAALSTSAFVAQL